MKNALLTLFFFAGLASTQLSAQSCCEWIPQCCAPSSCCVTNEKAAVDQPATLEATAACTPEQMKNCTPEEIKKCNVAATGARKTTTGTAAIANLRSKQNRATTVGTQKL